MAIESTGFIDQISDMAFQPRTLWEFYLDSKPEVRFRVQSTTLPFITFETDTRSAGTKHYTKYVPESNFDVTFFETTDFSTYDYMKEWMDEIFDPEERVFNVGFEEKVGLLCFSHFETEIIQEMIKSQKPGEMQTVQEELSYKVPGPDGTIATKTTLIQKQEMGEPVTEQIQVQGTNVEEKYNKVFRFEGLRLLGLAPVALNYESGEPLIYTCSFIADQVIPMPVENAPTSQATLGSDDGLRLRR